ncbi:GNAT superfamily N-acetyltransferase [Deinobacterium chartae]|uniref:GNAT superfamily N-acetyltransferase n=1 Tax=Deinobacterium chartae TaxID=521158 RepID=A0A841I325_9DEIO|nr:GNAT family N-acetyltransferase [Deinobacterium chartae]MBB6098769.1 GNAT superfamily N-acetyltransferase [Deinobacterium chartae]
MYPEWTEGPYTISSDPARLDLTVVHGYLSRSYWAQNIPFERVERAAKHSLCFGIYGPEGQVGFARVISDRATFAYLADVFVLEEARGQGLSKFLMRCVLAHPELQGLRRWMLMTQDAHGLYRQFGFTELAYPERGMEISRPGLYLDRSAQ